MGEQQPPLGTQAAFADRGAAPARAASASSGDASPSLRRLVDYAGRPWVVRERAAPLADDGPATLVLCFRCDVAGPIPQFRRVRQRLADFSEADLLEMLYRADY